MKAPSDGALKITAIEVNHAPVAPAYAYRFDYKGRSVVITGDIHLAGVGTLGDRGVEFVTTAISSTANVPPELDGLVVHIPEKQS